MYVVVPETGRYREFSSSEGYQRFEIPTEGMDFFTTSRDQVSKVIYPEDIEFFMSEFTEEHVLAKIVKDGMFALKYRLLIDGKPRCVQLKAAMIEEKNGKKIIVGINDIDNLVRQEEAYERRLSKAQEKATVDALTGVKNKYAYVMEEEKLNQQLKKNPDTEFAIVTLDINDLKKINDTDGHQAGDQFIRSACKIICNTFKHSPVFRVGGDEFAIIVRGDDYEQVEELTGKIQKHNNKAMKNGGIIIACGMSRKDGDNKVAPVYERADKNMYENKKALKLERQKVMDIQVS